MYAADNVDMWIQLGTKRSNLWPSGDLGAYRLVGTPGAEWLNLDTGASILLLGDGGYEDMAKGYAGRYVALHRIPGCPITDLTFALLREALNGGKYLADETGSDVYGAVLISCEEQIDQWLGTQEQFADHRGGASRPATLDTPQRKSRRGWRK